MAWVTLWVTSTTAKPRFLACMIIRNTWAASFTPRAAVGSSRIITLAPKYTARAMADTCRSPPDRLPTRRLPSVTRVMPIACISLTTISPAVLRSNTLNGPHPLVGSRPTKNERSRLISGNVPPNWCTVEIPRSAASLGLFSKCSRPSTRIVPEVGSWKPESTLIRVDLPAPLSPRRHSTSP